MAGGVDFVALEIIGSQVEIVVMPEFLKASFRALDTFTWSNLKSNWASESMIEVMASWRAYGNIHSRAYGLHVLRFRM